MCPGIAVLGGGGGAGGSGAGSSKKGKGKKKGKTSKKNKKAKNDKKNAKCGKGGKGKCGSCSAKPSAGEPVDIASGAVFTPALTDFFLPGLFDVEWQRSYSSRDAQADRGLGFGWSFTFGWSIQVEPKTVTVVDGHGTSATFVRPSVGEVAVTDGWVLEREEAGFILGSNSDFLHFFRPLPGAPHIWRLAVVLGPADARIALHYNDGGRLVDITDSAGRVIDVESNADGRITRVAVRDPLSGQTIVFCTYAYDERGDLVAFTNADGHTTTYRYDAAHRMTEHRLPTALAFKYVYDAQGRCVESWGEHLDGHPDPSIDPEHAQTLADNSPAKGPYHVKIAFGPDFREVVSGTEIQTYFLAEDGETMAKAVSNGGVTTRTFDEHGNVESLTDRNGATTQYEWDERGLLVRETDPVGRCVTFVRDASGRVVKTIDAAGGTIIADRTGQGFIEHIRDQLGAVTTYLWDERGLMREQVHANGARSLYQTDAHGNLTNVVLPNGASFQYRYDWWGRLVERVDPYGRVSSISWSDGGLPQSVVERDGSTWVYRCDALGNPTDVVFPDGAVERKAFGVVDLQYAHTFSNNDAVRGTYDLDGQLVRVVNERGEQYRIERTATGPVKVVTFGGRVHHRRFDAMGWLTSVDDGNGPVELTRDAAAQVTEITYADGTAETFRYSPLGEMTFAAGPSAVVSIERNAVDAVVRETVTLSDVTTEVRCAYSVDGERLELSSSFGTSFRTHRDAMQRPHVISLDEATHVTFTRDAFGRVTLMQLPGAAAIATEYDELTRVRARAVILPGAERRIDEPEWVGEKRSNALAKRYAYSPRGQVESVWNTRRGWTRYRYDDRDRLTAVIPERGAPEEFAYDATSNLFEVGVEAVQRRYGDGNEILERGPARYVYDDAGFLREKAVGAGDEERVWQYEWNAQRSLAAVERPDGVRVQFAYDAIGRRVSKAVLDVGAAGATTLRASTRYVWDDLRLLHEETQRYAPNGDALKTELRTYAFEDGASVAPFAERLVVTEQETRNDSGWLFYVTDIIGTVEEVIRPDGTVVATLERRAYGRTRVDGTFTTSVRFPGQYEDAETGLFYNLYRYFDPETASYISPDPIGIEGGLNVYAYCRNPVDTADPWGLAGHGLQFAVFGPPPANAPVSPGTPSGPGNWSPLASGGDKGLWTDPKWSNQKTGHTEAKALSLLDDPKNQAAKNAATGGGVAKMSGQFPPCKTCHDAMNEWAKTNNGKIEYHYPVKQTVTYNGKAGPQGNSGPANKLVNAYENPVLSPNATGGKSWNYTQVYNDQKKFAKAAAKNPPPGGLVNWPP